MTNFDGFINTLTGLGTGKDKKTHTKFNMGRIISNQELSMMYTTGGLFSTIVDCVADDMTRQGWYINNDQNNEISHKLKKLDTQSKINEALKWSRLYGGSLILIGVVDGLKLTEPIKENRIKDVSYLHVFDKSQVHIYREDMQNNPLLPGYGKAQYYNIYGQDGKMHKIHSSRILEFKGEIVPDNISIGEWFYFGLSVIQKILDEIEMLGTAFSSIATLLQEYTFGVFRFKNLAEMLAEGNEDLLRNRLKAVDMSKSIINSIVVDTEEGFSRETVSLAGIPDILDRFMMNLSGVTNIPISKLFGRSAGGLNASGDNELRIYYDLVKAEQEQKIANNLQKLIDLVNLQYNIENTSITFNSLYQKTDKEELEEQQIQAEIDRIYLETGVLAAEEVAKNRFTDGGFNYETQI